MLTPLRSRFLPILCPLLALLTPLGVSAQPQNGRALAIAGSVLHFSYQEFDDSGALLDREYGYIPGFVLGLSQTSDRWVFAGDIAYHGGDVSYEGQTNSAPPIPVNTRTVQNIADFAMRTEYWIHSRYAFYLGAGYHHWDRNIQPTTTASGTPVSGLFESYSWWTGFLGTKFPIYKSGSTSWLLDARLLQISNPAISINFNGKYDNTALALGEHLGVRLSFPWHYQFNRSSGINIEPYAESYELGRSATAPITSNGKVVGNVFEPRSQTANFGLAIGISQHF